MEGLIDNHISLNARDIGECIYCGERDVALATEHGIPYGLNGPGLCSERAVTHVRRSRLASNTM